MAFSFTKTTPDTGATAMYQLKERLKSAGWTVQASSDGTTHNSSGDQISSGVSGAGGFANNSAWVRLRSPAGAGGAEFVIQRGTVNANWRLKYSVTAGFSGGSPSATRVPSASDEVLIWGAGTDASPTYATLLGTDSFYRWNVAADDAAPYGFWAGAFPTGGGVPTGAFVYEPLSGLEPTDAGKYAIYLSGSGQNPFFVGQLSNESVAAASNTMWSSTPSTAPLSSDWRACPALVLGMYNSVDIVPSGLPTNPLSSKDEVFPIVYARRAALSPAFYKGVGTLMKWCGTTRTTGDTLSVSSSRDRIVYRDVSLPWDGSVPSV